MSLSGHGPTAAVNDVNDHLCETKTSSKSASSGGGGKCLSFQHERVVIQDRGFGRRRSPPWGGCDRVGAPQAAPCRPASAGAGDDELRWNADHHAGHALPATSPRAQRSRQRSRPGSRHPSAPSAAGSPRAAAAVLTSPRFNARHRCRAVPAVGVGLHAAGDRQPQRADQGPQFIFPAERRSRAQSQQSRRLHPLQSQQVMAAAVSAEPPARVCCWRRCGIAGRPVQVCCQGERGPATTAVFMSGSDPLLT